jgi:hypothetical protein
MGHDLELNAVNVLPPRSAFIAVAAVTTSSIALDLSTRTELADVEKGRFLTITVEQDTWLKFDTATGTVDETQVSGANQGYYIPAGGRLDVIVVQAYKWLMFKGRTAGFIRMYVSSRPPNATR